MWRESCDEAPRESCAVRFFALVVAAALVAPPPASAHVRSGRVAVDYRASVSPAPAGVAARIYESDLAVKLTVGTARSVVVLGYLGEPFIRITVAGVAVSPASATAAGARVVKRGRSVVWHDRRGVRARLLRV